MLVRAKLYKIKSQNARLTHPDNACIRTTRLKWTFHQEDSKNIMSGQKNSLVHSETNKSRVMSCRSRECRLHVMVKKNPTIKNT